MRYFFLYKPYGMLSQFSQEAPGQITLADVGFAFPRDAYPVGRLDADSEGLLLITNDRSVNARWLQPGRNVSKTYYAQVEGIPGASDLERLRGGVDISVNGKKHRTAAAEVRLLDAAPLLPERNPPIRYRKSVPDAWIAMTLTEGKNRQVRRMCAAAGYPVLRLVRTAIGPYSLWEPPLQGIGPGQVVECPELKI